ncbi:MAG: carboxypeptidase regulatory-like domain-containing protein, partial [Gemmatimonadetes bacterium]|nr:carboxypeptidase regulatory-like domain-containing protein [Gemmatimonadota bacterium]
TGKVSQTGGGPLEGATVVVTNLSTGQRFQVVSRAEGRFNIENLPPGGPYTLEVRAIGYQAGRRTGLRLSLGERFTSDFSLAQAVVEVQELQVTGTTDPLINRGRTGAASSVSDSAISNLPSLNRNFTDLISTSPAVAAGPGGRPSIAGSNDRFNSIQIDGSVNNDLFGLGNTGAPGGQTSGRAVPLDAVKEFQVLVAPFDVRQGGFTGGLVNAITKSGDNTFTGSAFIFRQSDALVTNTPHPEPTTFSTSQFGATFSGPIVRDKAHFFGSVDRQLSTTPYSGVIVGQDFDAAQGAARCDSVATHVRALGFEPGPGTSSGK